ncbi:MAG TPA: hypothetical protein VIC28_02660 [Thermoanaerobaculia bacterium]
MPTARSFADTIREWQQIRDAYGNNTANLTAGQTLLPELEALLTKALELKSRQENLKAVKQQITKEIGETVKAGTEVLLRLRSHAKGSLGTENEGLTEFKVAPRRKRGPRNKAKQKPPASGATTPAADSSAPAQPAAKPTPA